MSCAPCAEATPKRSSNGSTQSFADGPPTTTQVSAVAFGKLDHYLWKLTLKWATSSHANKPTDWIVRRYFGAFNKARQDRWVFGHRHSGSYLHRFAWTNIVRHQIVKHRASPDDPALADYWAWRRHKAPLPINRTALRLHRQQDGRCAICQATLLAASHRPTNPTRLGALAGHHSQDDRRRLGHSHLGRCCTPSHPPRLQHPPATRACLSRMPGNWHVRF
jgi:hypothetical protein